MSDKEFQSLPKDERSPDDDKEDVILPHSPLPDGSAWRVLRKREGRIEIGLLRPPKEGEAIMGEIVRLKQRPGTPLYDVEVLYSSEFSRKRGPAQVSTPAYREGWERIWGKRKEAKGPEEGGTPFLPN
ncbi:MAG: hypothetical protein N2515_02065 [Deltaproteobacteria bacterium]|nr:hypothetical protein [Sandaracinaceae bacterium]MCX7807369.1 hypothetical protein [Deltaproteobacteria bacterium]